jgi:hypothetical protein
VRSGALRYSLPMRTRIAPALALSAMLLAACTGGEAATAPSDPPGSAGSSAPAEEARAEVGTPDADAVVAAGKTPGALSIEVSKQLFDTAPVVVVTPATDLDAFGDAVDESKRLHAPLLLDDGTGKAAEQEVARLKARTVVAFGSGVADRMKAAGAEVAEPGTAEPLAEPEAQAGVAVLVPVGKAVLASPATKSKLAGSAAAATALAAGATVVDVNNNDPRTDEAAIEALSKAKPEHVVAVGAGFGKAEKVAARVAAAATGQQLPGGGQVVMPYRRLVALYGHPGTPGLGVLGEQGPDAAIARAKKVAAPYEKLSGDTPVVPAFEIIATVASAAAGPDGDYSYEAPVSLLEPWVRKAGAAGLYVVLDLQPGRENFLSQAKQYQKLLELPYVGLALDPEWRLTPTQRPLGQIGSTSAHEINSVITWLADLTKQKELPQKLFVLHQFRLSMIGSDEPLNRSRDEISVLVHMDGQGSTGQKDSTWGAVVGAQPKGVPFGWKNFYDEDEPMLTPAQTMVRKPTPLMISYQ